MPLVSAPFTGYPEGQRIDNYDSGTLWSTATASGTAPVTSPVMNMQHYACAGGFLLSNQNMCNCTLTWYADPLLANEIAARTIMLDHAIAAQLGAMLIPNMGPYLQITVTNVGGVAFQFGAYIFGSNRTAPVMFLPQNALVIDQQNVALVNGTNSYFPSDYYAGPAILYVQPAVALSFVLIKALTPGGSYDQYWVAGPIAANTFNNYNVVLPAGAWVVFVNAGAASANANYLTVIPSTTGAS